MSASDILRKVLALLDVKVRGAEHVTRANKQVDSLRENLSRGLQVPGGDDMFSQAMRRAVIGGRDAMATTAPVTGQLNAGLLNLAAGLNVATMAAGTAHRVLESAIAPVVHMVEEVIELGDALEAQAAQTGLSTDVLQEWRFIAERGNVDADALVGAMSRLQRQAASSPKELRKLGVTLRGANGQVRSASELFRDTGLAIAGIEDPAQRAARAQAIFGRSGRQLLPIFAGGAAGIDEMMQRFDELGGGLSEDVVAGAAAADDALVDFRLSVTSLKGVLASSVLPIISDFIGGIASTVGWLVDLVKHSSVVQATLGSLAVIAGVLAIALFPIWAPLVAIIAVFALGLAGIVIAVEDVVTAFRGGQSVFGNWVEGLLASIGLTTTFEGALEALGVAWHQLKAVVLESVGSMLGSLDRLQRALGVQIFAGAGEAAADVMGDAAMARSAAAAANKERAMNEFARFRDRATDAQATIRERGEAASVGIRKKPRGETTEGRGSRSVRVSHRPTYIIQGNDPAAIRREIEAHEARRNRELGDIIPEGPDDDEDD